MCARVLSVGESMSSAAVCQMRLSVCPTPYTSFVAARGHPAVSDGLVAVVVFVVDDFVVVVVVAPVIDVVCPCCRCCRCACCRRCFTVK